MTSGFRRIVGVVIPLVLLMIWVPAIPAHAGGLGAGPSNLEVTDALRGGQYERLITIFNLGDNETPFALSTTGDVADWISFYEATDGHTRLDTVVVPAKGEATVSVIVRIPRGAANGAYEGVITIQSSADEDVPGSAQMVSVSTEIYITVAVTGTQMLSGAVSSIRIRDTEEGYPLTVEAFFQNTGNVEARPEFIVEMSQEGGGAKAFTTVGEAVAPETSRIVRVECDTSKLRCGDYLCRVTVSLEGEVIATETLEVAILPRGTLTRSGICGEIVFEAAELVGAVSKIVATFTNDGQINTNAKLVGEVYRDGVLVDVINGDEMLVPVGYTEKLVAYLRLETPGEYVIKAHVVYEGKRTDAVDIAVEAVSSDSVAASGSAIHLQWQWVLFGTVVALMLTGLASTYWQKRQKAESARAKE